MQVALQSPNSFSSTAPLSRGQVSRTAGVGQVTDVTGSRTSDFPDSPFISTRPLRYNVQLNEQLTSVQQADNFLRKVENHLLALRQGVSSNGAVSAAKLQKHADSLTSLMDKRNAYSGGTVDRRLNAVLGEKQPQVNFSLQGIGNVLQKPEGETLIFSLAGTKRDIAAVTIRENSSPSQVLRSLNLGLGKFGVQGKSVDGNQVVFAVNESQWERVSEHLSVRGEGQRYPDGVFYPLKAVAEPAPEDTIRKVSDNLSGARSQLRDIQGILEQVNGQRRQLMQIKDNVRSRIDGMATFQNEGAALQASAILSDKLSSGSNDFSTVTQALGGQANVRSLTVRNLLG
ncbi:Uncharacterised protein [Pragia fontium]|uniref:hypothetical protein n=1 Tax=Pragia fontium TaxID=82985 RepID=UPI000DFB1FD1|nr:hypothetical protein [Pragia fontium]SUB81643.1 Uncharacterised protein [Pragia fontium]